MTYTDSQTLEVVERNTFTLEGLAEGDDNNAILIFHGSCVGYVNPNILRFLTIPTLPQASGRRKTSEAKIDCSKSILLTLDKYMTQLEEKILNKMKVEEARMKKANQSQHKQKRYGTALGGFTRHVYMYTRA